MKIFSVDNNKNNKHNIYCLFGVKIKLRKDFIKSKISPLIYGGGDCAYVDFFWQDEFNEYFKLNDMSLKLSQLKNNLDDISCEYADYFMKLVPYWNRYKIGIWSDYDKKTIKKYKEFLKTFNQPFPEILTIDPYFYSNMYGLTDLPEEILSKINGKTIIDGGGANGDTALVFHKYFPLSQIDVFEPVKDNLDVINKILSVDNCGGKITPVNYGLGEKSETIKIDDKDAKLISVDEYYAKSEKEIGLIKLDTESCEADIIKGAVNVLRKDKPVLAIAMYHTPIDFFELKTQLENLNLGYKFMIRRSQMILPQADLVLIAY